MYRAVLASRNSGCAVAPARATLAGTAAGTAAEDFEVAPSAVKGHAVGALGRESDAPMPLGGGVPEEASLQCGVVVVGACKSDDAVAVEVAASTA